MSGCTEESVDTLSKDNEFLVWFHSSQNRITYIIDSLNPYFEKRLMDIWDYNISKYITKNTYDDNNLLYWGEQLEKTASSEKNELSSFYEEDLSNDMNHLLTLYEMALIKLHDCGLNAKMAGQYGSTSGYEEYIQTAKEALSVYNNYMREALEIINSD